MSGEDESSAEQVPEQLRAELAHGGRCGHGPCTDPGSVLAWHQGPVYLDFIWSCDAHEAALPPELESRARVASTARPQVLWRGGRQVRISEETAEAAEMHGQVLDLEDVLPEIKRPEQGWCPGSRMIVFIADAAAVCAACGMEWHGIGAPRAALPRHLPWMLEPAADKGGPRAQ